MPRYIDSHVAESLIAEMAREPEFQHEDEDWRMGLCMAERAISETPTADVVEVVRCKDCKYWGGSTFGYVCEVWSGMDLKNHTRPNGFCNYGERKEQT